MSAWFDGDEFTCDCCHGTFEKAWSGEEAMQEAEDNGFLDKPTPLAIVCDDCYVEIMAAHA